MMNKMDKIRCNYVKPTTATCSKGTQDRTIV